MVKWALTILLALSAPAGLYFIYAAAYSALHFSTDISGLALCVVWLTSAAFVIRLWQQRLPDKSISHIISTVVVGGVLTFLSVGTAFLFIILASWDSDMIGQYP